MERIPWRLAIDFGTSNSAAAVAQENDGPHALRLGARSDAIPSCVAAYNGEILTGDAALQTSGIYPAAFEPTPKRRLGEEAVVLGSDICDPVDLVAAVLGFIVGQAIRFVGGGSPAQVVLTHPEAWDEYMKGRLRAAAVKAGIPEESIVLMPEPVAAGWHYAAGSDVGSGTHVAVLDFGGGTCDAAVLELAQTPDGPAFHVVAADGIDPLGGHDFDAQLETWVYSQLAAEGKDELLDGLKSEHSGADRAHLRDQIREAKHALSFHASAPIGVRSGQHEWVCTVTRAEFEQLIEPQLSRAVDLVQQVIQEALPSAEQLRKVYLTGGSSHIPALQAKLSEILPMKLGLMGDPKQVTSIGALEAPRAARRIADSNVPGLQAKAPAREPADKQAASRGNRGSRSGMLVAGGVAASVALIAAAFALAPGGTPRAPSSTSPSSSSSAGPTGTVARQCGGKERPDLREGECNLLTRVSSLKRVAPDSCVPNKDLAGASAGLVCAPPANSNFSSSERPELSVYAYESAQALNTSFDGLIKRFNASEDSATKPPGWERWPHAQAPRGRILSASEDGTNYLIWTEDEPLMEIWAVSKEADIAKLYAWWDQ